MAKSKKSDAVAPPPAPADYTVVARRYRPQQFADLIGQEHVAQALTNAITSGRIAHAYLFTGARGTGKTSTARILAKALNCATGPTPTPCDACDICKGVAAGDDVDVIEIDGASNNKVEEVRDLRQNVGFRPARARFKIYIIDEVHMLSAGAFNALLKTLEEPPAHVKFILATTETHKIPITILSRCQKFDFAHVGRQNIFAQLKYVVGKEGLAADDAALHIIARRAAGSIRDSQSLLDQMLAFAEGNLTAEKVHTVLGTAADDRVAALAGAILRHDAKAALDLVAQYADAGLQLGELLDQLVDYWRGLMLVLAAGPDAVGDIDATTRDAMTGHATLTTLDAVMAGLDVLTTTKGKARGGSHVQTLVELAAVRLARLEELLPVAQLAQMLGSGGSAPAAKAAGPAVRPPEAEPSKKNAPPAPNGPVSPDDPSVVWGQLLDAIGPILAARLRSARPPVRIGPTAVAGRFPASYRQAYDECADDRTKELLGAAWKRLTGATVDVRVEIDDAPAGVQTPEPARRPTSRRQEWLQTPLFALVQSKLDGQLVNLDPDFGTAPAPTAAAADPDEG